MVNARNDWDLSEHGNAVVPVQQLQGLLDSLLSVVRKVLETDWPELFRRYEAGLLSMADNGWTLVEWSPPNLIPDAVVQDPEQLDAYFTEGYMANNASHLDELHRTLVESPEFAQWTLLLEEIFVCIREGRHRVAIPAAFTIIEGLIASSLHRISNISSSNVSVLKSLKNAGWHEKENLEAFFWRSGIAFLDKVFATSDFAQSQPPFVNRHWILHGRSSVDWKLADALRLVNALWTLNFLFAILPEQPSVGTTE